MWARKYKKCVNCGTAEEKHRAQGLCVKCYQKMIERKHKNQNRRRRIAGKILTKEYLLEHYFKKHESLSDIAKKCSCSRQYVYKKMRAYKIPLRSQRSARKLALKQKKLVVERVDDDGTRRSVVYQRLKLNEKFFSTWSPEMAYVLGVLFTDGCLSFRKQIGKTTVRRLPTLSIAQKEPELLKKILILMDCNAKLHMRKRKIYGSNVSGAAYWFKFDCASIYPDLVRLGLHPNKSLNIEFPVIPTEYVRHFIRGCWDGDGSVYYESKRDYIRATYVSGSLKFIEGMLAEFEKAGLPKRTIYERKGKMPSYAFTFSGPQCISLYHYFYDGVSSNQYLGRKYESFKKFCDRQQNSLF